MRVERDHPFASTVPIAINLHSVDESARGRLAAIVHAQEVDLARVIDIMREIIAKSTEWLKEINHLSEFLNYFMKNSLL
jgi:hypothetical protein